MSSIGEKGRVSLFMAVGAKRSPRGLIHHSDRGSQYCSHDYKKLLDQFGMRASMSRKGKCYDNAPMESLWGTLKNELIYHRHYKTREEARKEISANTSRCSTIGNGGKSGLAIYPLLPMNGSSMPQRRPHDE